MSRENPNNSKNIVRGLMEWMGILGGFAILADGLAVTALETQPMSAEKIIAGTILASVALFSAAERREHSRPANR